MPVVKGSKQQKLIVVPYRPLRVVYTSAGLISGLLLAGWCSWQMGFNYSVNQSGNAVQERDVLRESVARLTAETTTLREQLISIEQASSLDKKTLANVQQTILALREQISQLEEDVLFYKQIMSPENAETGLVVGQLDLVATDRPGTIRYKLELKQQGNNEQVINGHANISLLGNLQDEEVVIPLKDVSLTEDRLDIRLQFRYFQNIEGELVLPEGFEPAKVQIVAVAEGNNPQTIQKSFGWVVEN